MNSVTRDRFGGCQWATLLVWLCASCWLGATGAAAAVVETRTIESSHAHDCAAEGHAAPAPDHRKAATTPTLVNYALTPTVIASTATGEVRLAARIDGPSPTSVQFVANWGSTYTLLDNGSGSDATAGDGVYSVAIPVQQILARRKADDVFRVDIGFLDVYSGSTRLGRVNASAQVRGPEIPAVSIKPLGGSAQMSRHLLNVSSAALFRTHNLTTPEISTVAQLAYQYLADQFDFLNIVFDRAQIENRYHFFTRNAVSGIGSPITNNNGQYGGASKLVGISVFPLSDYFDGAAVAHQHELGHQWINGLSNALTRSGLPHWPASTMATDIMGLSIPGSGAGGNFGCRLTPEGSGLRVSAVATSRPMSFNPLDLYLMGLMPASEVPDQWVVTDPNFLANWQTLCDGRLLTSGFSRLSVNDVIAANGPRVPDYSAAQRTFRVATVVVSDGLLSADAMAFYDYFAQRMEARERLPVHEGFLKQAGAPFFVATGGRGALIATVDTAVTVPTRVTMVEYYHAGFNYYFITSQDAEKAILDSATGWARTGVSYPMLAYPEPLVSGNVRFYFDRIARAGTRGSHVYTINPVEVAALSALNPANAATPRLPQNEGVDNFAYRPNGSGVNATCGAGLLPVYRVFRGNIKFPDDPNHRFTPSLAVYNQFVGQGWDGEGVAFCVPAN